MFHVGVPAKSGVGGGILAVVPGRYAIAAFAPPLDEAGNSVRAQKAIASIVAHARRKRVRRAGDPRRAPPATPAMRAEQPTEPIRRVHRRRAWICLLCALVLADARVASAQNKDDNEPESAAAAGPGGGKEGATGPAKPVSEKAAEQAESESKDWNSMTWGELDPGRGFRVANTKLGDLWISGYALVRYINQLPASATYFDHLGRMQTYSGRNDIEFHRALLFFRGWVFLPKLEYNITHVDGALAINW